MARKWWTLAAVVTGLFMLLLDVTIVIVALPDIQSSLGSSLSDLQWVLDAYALSLAVLLLTAGVLADRYGRRAYFAAGTAIFTLGSLSCALAQTPLELTLSRAGQGVGGAMMFATSLALLGHTFRGRDRGIAFGVFGACAGVATAVGPVLGGVLVSLLSWRWIFLVNLPVGVVAIAITLVYVEESRDPVRRRLDWPGFLTFSLGLAALIYALIRGGEDGWGSSIVLSCFVAAGVLLVGFVVTELVRRDPMLDLALLRKPTFSGGLVAAFAMSGSLFALLTYVVIYFQTVLGYSAMETGVRVLILSGCTFLTAGAAGRLTSSVSPRALIAPGFVLVGAGLLVMRGLDASSGWTHWIPGLILGGIGSGLINVPLASTAIGVVKPQRAGMASGINSTFRQVGLATGIAALGSIFAHQLRDGVAAALDGTVAQSYTAGVLAGVGGPGGGRGPAGGADMPPAAQEAIGRAIRSGFDGALNDILLIGAVVALVAAGITAVTIRRRDFVDPAGEPDEGELVNAAA
ncbi:MAG: MFS transporter [Nocardioidaceae bacterium]